MRGGEIIVELVGIITMLDEKRCYDQADKIKQDEKKKRFLINVKGDIFQAIFSGLGKAGLDQISDC